MSKKALLIGINYFDSPAAKLNGCINDVVNVRNMLIDAYGYDTANITVLRDDGSNIKPTANNILKELSSIISQSASLKEIWIHYSGHGSQIKDGINGDESDGMDEIIVPCDYTTAGVIRDDMIFSIIKQTKCPTMLTFDSCSSGTVCDLMWNFNAVSATQVSVVKTNNALIKNQNIFCLSGCRDEQSSADIYNTSSQQSCGALTTAFIETLRSNKHNVDVKTLYVGITAYLKQMGMEQIPQFSSSSQRPAYQIARPPVATLPAQRVAPMQIIMKGRRL
jgi:hypothetical protein